MTKLGHGDLWSRTRRAVRGLISRPRPHRQSGRPVSVIGHRGAAKFAPENTRASFECAVERGATAIETDVCVTRDGRFVLWHDRDPREAITVARELGESQAYVANEPAIGSPFRRPVQEIDYEDFMREFGYTRRGNPVVTVLETNTRPEIPPEPIESLLDYAKGEPRLKDVYVDVKLYRGQEPDAGRLAELLRDGGDTRFHLLSTEREILPVLREAAAGPVYGDFELADVLSVARALQLRHVSMGCGQRWWTSFHREVCDVVAARDRGELERVIVWSFDDEERLRALVECGVDGIMTNEAETLCRVLDQQGAPR